MQGSDAEAIKKASDLALDNLSQGFRPDRPICKKPSLRYVKKVVTSVNQSTSQSTRRIKTEGEMEQWRESREFDSAKYDAYDEDHLFTLPHRTEEDAQGTKFAPHMRSIVFK